MFIGVGIGYLLRRLPVARITGKSIQLTIYLLLALLGMTVGSNHYLISHLKDFSGQALVLAIMGMGGSIITTWLITRKSRKKGKL